MKKTLLVLLALSISLFANGANHKCGAGKCGAQMTKQTPKKKGKPFLIQGQLPHLTGLVKMLWDDEDLALSADQKKQLLIIRKNTMTQAKALGKKINALESEIVKKALDGAVPSTLEAKVKELALLRAEATMVHLRCIFDTRKILTDEQRYILE